jgi:hypothetical protein
LGLASGLIGVMYSRVEQSDEWGDQVRVEGGRVDVSLLIHPSRDAMQFRWRWQELVIGGQEQKEAGRSMHGRDLNGKQDRKWTSSESTFLIFVHRHSSQ